MGLRTVQYSTSTKISCLACAAGDESVILCVNPEKVGFPACPADMTSDNSDDETYIRTYVEATVSAVNCIKSGCNTKFYLYTFQYDDAQLRPNETLVPTDITGVFCQDCMTQWVKDYVGNDVEVTVDDDSGLVTITNEHGCQASFNSTTGIAEWTPVVTGEGVGTLVQELVRDTYYTRNASEINIYAEIIVEVTAGVIDAVKVSGLPFVGGPFFGGQLMGGQVILAFGVGFQPDGYIEIPPSESYGLVYQSTGGAPGGATFAVGRYSLRLNFRYLTTIA